jgi:hypothetical protein
MIPIELDYNIYHKGKLVILSAMKKSIYYLEGMEYDILVFFDYKKLEYFTTTKRSHLSYIKEAQEFVSSNFEIDYCSRKLDEKPGTVYSLTEYYAEWSDSSKNILLIILLL